MCVCVCVYTCIYIYICLCMYVCVCVHRLSTYDSMRTCSNTDWKLHKQPDQWNGGSNQQP